MTVLMRGNRTYRTDDANRADSDTLGSFWRADVNAQPRVRSNRIEFKNIGNGDGRAGNWASAPALDTDSYEITAQLIAPSTGNQATDNITALVLAVPEVGSSSALIAVFATSTGSGCGIFSQVSSSIPASGIATGGSGSVSRNTGTGNIPNTAQITFRRVMYSATQSIFTGYYNGVQVAQWDDSTGLISTGPQQRRPGFVVEGNHQFLGSDYRSPAIDWISARDLW